MTAKANDGIASPELMGVGASGKNQATLSRCLLSAAIVAWGIPIVGLICAQFVRHTYQHGEYINPHDDVLIYSAVTGWCVASCTFLATLLLWKNVGRRYALWSLGLSGTYSLTPLAIALNWCIGLALHHLHIL